MTRKSSPLIAILLSTLTSAAFAGGSYVGLVKPVYYSTLYLDASATQMSGRPACATRTYVKLQESPGEAIHKDKFAIILSAWLSQTPISLAGTGTCTSEGDEIIYVVAFP
jgi:hypothetical protein